MSFGNTMAAHCLSLLSAGGRYLYLGISKNRGNCLELARCMTFGLAQDTKLVTASIKRGVWWREPIAVWVRISIKLVFAINFPGSIHYCHTILIDSNMPCTSKAIVQKFVRRKKNLLKRSHELARLCEAEVAIIIYKNGKYYTYRSTDKDSWPPSVADIVCFRDRYCPGHRLTPVIRTCPILSLSNCSLKIL